MKSTKKSLLLSTLSLIMCIAMLLGTTYAWFTDSVTSGKNIITAGNLDIEMYYADGTEDPASVTWDDASDATIFNYNLWEPGYTDVKHIKIANVGSLALKYQLAIVADGDLGILADVLDVYVTDTATKIADRSDLSSMTKIGTLSEVLANASLDLTGNLMPKGTVGKTSENTLTIAVKMQETAGNEYQNKAIANGFTVVVKATQYTYEKDSFNNQYDKDATYPEIFIPTTHKPKTAAKVQEAITQAANGDIVELPNSTADAPIKMASLDVKNKELTFTGTKDTVFQITPDSGQFTGDYTADLVFDGITIQGVDATKRNYSGFCAKTILFKNCTITKCMYLYGTEVTFENCTFVQSEYEYSVYTYGAKVANFNNCVFNCTGKALKPYNDGNDTTVNVTNCKFYSDGTGKSGNPDKPAIAVAVDNDGKIAVNITECTQEGFFANKDSAMTPFYNGSPLVGTETAKSTIFVDGTKIYPAN